MLECATDFKVTFNVVGHRLKGTPFHLTHDHVTRCLNKNTDGNTFDELLLPCRKVVAIKKLNIFALNDIKHGYLSWF